MKQALQSGFLTLVYLILYLPILVLIVFSFNSAKYSLVWHGFSLNWYTELFHDSELWVAFVHSIILGVSTSIIATTIGLLGSVFMYLHPKRKQRQTFMGMLMLLIIVPDLILGVSLLILFNLLNLPLGFITLLIAHITFCLPFVILTLQSRIHTIDPNLYYCALDLGASKTKALTKVMLPLLWPAVLSAFLLCFTLSFDDIIVSYFVAGPDFNILPLTIYALVRTGVTPELNALCAFTLLISMILVIMAHLLSRKEP